MNHDDLERRLRSEHGSREAGYAAQPLPGSLAAQSRQMPSLLRGGLLAAAAAAGLLVALAVTGNLGAAPEVGGDPVGSHVAVATPTEAVATPATPTATPTPTPTPTPGGAIAACATGDVDATAEPWGGAAGSRGTLVTLSLAGGAMPCALDGATGARVLDRSGSLVVDGVAEPNLNPVRPILGDDAAGRGAFSIGVTWSTWCDAAPAAPLTFEVSVGSATWITDQAPLVPPCLGDGGTSLSVVGPQPAP